MGKRPSLVKQVENELTGKMQAGRSKHNDKKNKIESDVIYSYQTLKTYLRQCAHCVKWARAKYKCRLLSDVKQYVPEYLMMRINDGKSPYTVHTDAAALAKLFGCTIRDWGVKLPVRARAVIVRSRNICYHDTEYSRKNNKNLIDFCRGCGLRRHELIALKPTDISPDGSKIIVNRGKGGKRRVIPVLPEFQAHIANMRLQAIANSRDKVFTREEIKGRIDIHAYRREYAQALYAYYERTGEYTSHTLYCCRRDCAGIHYDRGIMMGVSRALGHERLDVISISYLN